MQQGPDQSGPVCYGLELLQSRHNRGQAGGRAASS